MKKLLTILVALLMVCSFVGCTPTDQPEETFEIAVVTDVGQLNDGGFNQGTYEGAVAFAQATGKTYKYYQPANGKDATDDDRIAAMKNAIENGAKVIVAPGYKQFDAINAVAESNPEVKFVFVDGWSFGKSNVTAISYKEQESGYFAGYAAVKEGFTKLGGTFGGDGANAACNRFAYGYVQGANAAAKELGKKVDVTISFLFGGNFAASPELQTQISGWYNSGIEVVFSCGGSMLESVKAAAEETDNGMIIGVDVDQAKESDRVITSAVKGLSVSVQKVLNQWLEGKWDSELSDKISNLGASDDATGLPTASASWRMKNFTVEEYKALFADVKSGKVVIDGNIGDKMGSEEAWAEIAKVMTNVNLIIED